MTTTRSINLSEHEVRAALDDKLSLVVRPVKPQPMDIYQNGILEKLLSQEIHRCPLGVPGDRVVCKETWCNIWPFTGKTCPGGPCYRATDEGDCGAAITGQRWRSPSTMPRWASRITLEVGEVRCVRFGELSHADAKLCGFIDEGIGYFIPMQHAWNRRYGKRYPWESNPWVWAANVKRVEG